MGYESRIHVVDRYKGCYGKASGHEIAMFELHKMGYEKYNGKSFRELYTTPVDFDIFCVEDLDDDIDCYGNKICYTSDIDSVIAWLEQSEKHEPYRRAKLFLNFLKTLKESANDFKQICLVHFGH